MMHLDAEQSLAALTDEFLNDYFAFYPSHASILGLHDYDGRIANFELDSLHTRVETLQRYRARLDAIDPTGLGRLSWFDYQLLRWRIDAEQWKWTEQREYERNPLFHTDYITFDYYIQRNYAPLEVRAEALTRHLRQIPAALTTARHMLHPQLPQVLLEESLPVFDGLVTYMEQSLTETFGNGKLPAALERELWAAGTQASEAIEELKHHVTDTLLPQATEHFAIGAEHFANMLRYNELIDLPLDDLLAVGEEDLARNKAALMELAAQVDPSKTVQEHMQKLGRNHPTADQLLDETRALLESLRSFVIEHDLVTIPTEKHCMVQETPPFARWAFAMMDTAGPFEAVANESFYYVTLPEADWPPEKVEGWLTKFDYATMTGVSIHEAYPGHYVHFMNVRHAPTRLAKVFDTYSHFESWAHYVEQMMLEEGFGAGNVHLRMAQLGEALVRNCRYVCAIKMHTQGMSIEEATSFFEQTAYMDHVTANKEARRGTHDPGYLNYTLGKLLLLKLREEYQQAWGSQFSLKRFHDEYIGYGSPPIPILRSMLLPHTANSLLQVRL